MKIARTLALAAAVGATIITATGCSVVREQQTVGSYVDDSAITTAVKNAGVLLYVRLKGA